MGVQRQPDAVDERLMAILGELRDAYPDHAIALLLESGPDSGSFRVISLANTAGFANMAVELLHEAVAGHVETGCRACSAAARGMRAALKVLRRERRLSGPTCH